MRAAAATQVWSEDLERTGVTANVLIPGRAADTDFMPKDWREGGSHRSGAEPAPQEVMAPPALFLTSDASNGFNGLRFEADKWDTEIDPAEAAKKNARPVGFLLHEQE